MSHQAPQLKVLIADDSTVVRERLTTLLEELPGVWVVAATGTVRLTKAAIQEQRPDVVILDLNMPDGNTFEVIRHMREEQLRAEVLVLTNYPCPEYEQRALGEGADAFFDKTYEFMKLRDRVLDLAQGAGRTT